MIKLAMKKEIDGHILEVKDFLGEPNTGLCIVSYRDWKFTLPNVFVELIFANANELQTKIGKLKKLIDKIVPLGPDEVTAKQIAELKMFIKKE